jgi:hypothetical protein
MVADVVDKYPHDYGDIVSLFYFCTKTKVNIQVRSDQDLVEMFAKHRAFITAVGLDGVVFVPARTVPLGHICSDRHCPCLPSGVSRSPPVRKL